MQKEIYYKADEIVRTIDYNKDAINVLSGLCEEDKDSDIYLYTKSTDITFLWSKRITFPVQRLRKLYKTRKIG